MKKIAISVQTYNGSYADLTMTFDSIFCQTNREFVSYLVDNGSDEEYKKMYEKFCEDKDIKIIRVEKNEGIGSGRNAAMRIREKYLLRVDIGDTIEKKFIEKLSKAIKNTEYDVVFFREIVKGKRKPIFLEKLMSVILLNKKIHGSGMIDTVFNLDFIRKIGFIYPKNLIEDFNSNIFILSKANKVR